MEATQAIRRMEPEVLMAISSYREKGKEIMKGIHELMRELGGHKVDAQQARKLMDKHIPKTEKLSKEIELMREE